MVARQQLLKFSDNKPSGTRFAVFVLSDTLRLIQGFTDDKNQLFAATDPRKPKPHIPRVFLYGENYRKGDSILMISVLNRIAQYVEELPGRKNLIWFSGSFPLNLFPNENDPPEVEEEVRVAIDALVRSQIALYPIDVRGVVTDDPRGPASTAMHKSTGITLLTEYQNDEKLASLTGGRAFYSTNDLKGALADATDNGGNYYTLTYAPNNENYDGKLRKIRVELSKKGFELAYRRSYYAEDPNSMALGKSATRTEAAHNSAISIRKTGDSLYANMQYGAPTAHQIYFRARVHVEGAPMLATPEQMASLADEPAYFRIRHKDWAAKPLPPIQIQTYAIDYFNH